MRWVLQNLVNKIFEKKFLKKLHAHPWAPLVHWHGTKLRLARDKVVTPVATVAATANSDNNVATNLVIIVIEE